MSMSSRSLALILGLGLVPACTGHRASGGRMEISSEQTAAQQLPPKTPQTQPPPASVSDAVNALAFDLLGPFGEMAQGDNLFYSPFSIHTALTMTWAGATPPNSEEMAAVLRLSEHRSIHDDYSALIASVESAATGDLELAVANRLFGQEGFDFHEEFTRRLESSYGSGLETVDFRESVEVAARINSWVSEKTRARIQDLLPPDAITGATRLVLVNAIYFLGQWKDEFSPERTTEQPFTRADGSTGDVDLMEMTSRFRYAEVDEVQYLELPYAGDEISMVVVLPRSHEGLGPMIEGLSFDSLERSLDEMRLHEVRVFLPRFRVETGLTLREPLHDLGMRLVFCGGGGGDGEGTLPRFGGISETDLCVDEGYHKAFVEVDERGTEAAAATGIVMMKISGGLESRPPPVFRADRPFLFFIRHVESGAVLFVGRIGDPSA